MIETVSGTYAQTFKSGETLDDFLPWSKEPVNLCKQELYKDITVYGSETFWIIDDYRLGLENWSDAIVGFSIKEDMDTYYGYIRLALLDNTDSWKVVVIETVYVQ